MTSLIDYATFFGSINIFLYLLRNEAQLTTNSWLYAVHSNNPEILSYLDESSLKDHLTYVNCLKESIKCHHNEMARYFYDNLINEDHKEDEINEMVYTTAFRYCNFSYFPVDLKKFKNYFVDAFRYNYITLVKIILNNESVDVNTEIILKKIIFLIKFQNLFFFFK